MLSGPNPNSGEVTDVAIPRPTAVSSLIRNGPVRDSFMPSRGGSIVTSTLPANLRPSWHTVTAIRGMGSFEPGMT